MDVHHQRIDLHLGYPVHFTRHVFSTNNPCLLRALARDGGERTRLWVILDDGAARAWPELEDQLRAYVAVHAPRLSLLAPPLVMPGGDAAKRDPAVVATLHRRFLELRMDAEATLIVVGGGALQDVVSYAAATAQPGIAVVRIPTTTLAQAGAGLSVRARVHAYGQRDFLQALAVPSAVINDVTFARTQSPAEQRGGVALALCAAVRGDAALFREIRGLIDPLRRGQEDALEVVARRCVQLHVPSDASDQERPGIAESVAEMLQLLSNSATPGGDALAMGLAVEVLCSSEAGACRPRMAQVVLETLRSIGFPLWDPVLEARDRDRRLHLLHAVRGTPTLLRDVGLRGDAEALKPSWLEAALHELRASGDAS